MARVSRIKKQKVLVNDADSSVYAIGFMTQKKQHYLLDENKKIVGEWDDKRKLNKWQKENDPSLLLEYDYTEDIEPVSFALSSAKKFIANMLDYTGCDRTILLLTKGGNCFRHNLATIQKYKGNRDGMSKPYHYDAIRDYYCVYHGAKVYDKWEADDAACMALHRGSGIDGVDYILSTIDKDLAQQAGRHVNPNKKDEGVYVINEVEGWYNFYHQMLMGDQADNIKGLSGKKGAPGIGKAKATKLLAPAGDDITLMCQIVYDEYLIRYGDKPFAYAPWWTDPATNINAEFLDKPEVLTGTALTMFR
ncbi:MAG: hypothetical protein V3T88_05505, partial [Nitrosomonadaceae bacterium]